MAGRNGKGSLFLLAALAAVIVVLAAQVKPAVAVPYTDGGDIQTIVNEEVTKAKDKAPGLVRLVFHDCFVRGCDASVLLIKTPTNPAGKTEQNSTSNGGLRGLEVIDAIRTRLSAKGISISCADAIVFAAREATNVLSNGKIKYYVDGTGRDDGVVSSDQDPGRFLPGPSFTFDQLMASFKAKEKQGFGLTDLVALSGGHCIGVSHLTSFTDRITAPVTGQINATYVTAVGMEGPKSTNGVKNNVRDFGDAAKKVSMYEPNGVDMKAVGVLDNSYYNANLQNMVLFTSDWALRTNAAAEKLLEDYKKDANLWNAAFGAAMTKLSNNLKAEGPQFEVGYRKVCSATNKDSYP